MLYIHIDMKSILFFLLGLALSLSGQDQNIIQPERIESTVQKSNLNRIVFLDKVIPMENLKETDFMNRITFQDDKDFDVRVFMDNSLVNYLHRLDPSLSVDELLQKGNYQFTFYVDGKLIYRENLNPGAGKADAKRSKTTFRIPFISSTSEDSWGRYLWTRFYLTNEGIDVLGPGNHILTIEIRPYLEAPTLQTGEVIAKGEINLVVQQKEIPEQLISIQKIKPGSGWEISKDKFDTDKIRLLNRKIAENRFKDITSIIVIKNGKLLIEEYFNGSGRDSLQDTRSVGKSFASALTGIAIRDGYLRSEYQHLNEFYNLKRFKNYSSEKDHVTIKSLLTMSSGFEGNDDFPDSPGNEENMYPTDNWIHFALDLPVAPHKNWSYFTAGVVLTGDILEQSVPEGLEKYAHKKLFQPLGIERYKWFYTPQKKPSLAGGLRMRSLDFAKFGQLYQNKGLWNGNTILDKDWIKKSFHNYFPDHDNFDGYGYLFWRKVYRTSNRIFETYQSSGNGGNKVIMCTEIPVVIVITAKAYNKPYAHSQADKIVQEYLLPAIDEP